MIKDAKAQFLWSDFRSPNITMTDESTFWLFDAVKRQLVPPTDTGSILGGAGVQLGHGCFETILVDDGYAGFLSEHLDRLFAAAAVLGIPIDPSVSLWREEIGAFIKAATKTATSRLRLTLLSGRADLTTGSSSGSFLLLQLQPYAARQDAYDLFLLPWRKDEGSPLAGLKSISYSEHILARQFLAERASGLADGASCEGAFLNQSGHVCEAVWANLFVKHQDQWYTPPLSSGCLPGIMRGHVLAQAESGGLHIKVADISEDQLMSAEAIGITSSLLGFRPARSLEGRSLDAESCRELAALVR